MGTTVLKHHYRTPYLRPLPHYRTYFFALLQSCNPFVRSSDLSPRRIFFLVIFLMRTVQTGWYLSLAVSGAAKSNAIWVLVLICFVAFTVELWNLHLLVEAEGEGMIFGTSIHRGLFALFLLWTVVWHLWLVPLEVNGLAFYLAAGITFMFEGFWLTILIFLAWVANREVKGDGILLA